jgi:integrase
MIRVDLKAAGIPYDTPDGVFDFHALRHQFLTDVASSGVHPKVAQELARHSTITRTMDRYSQVLDGQKKTALESLPLWGVGRKMDSRLCP